MEYDTGQAALTWGVRALYGGSAVAYLAHLWLLWRRVREASATGFGALPVRPPLRTVIVEAEVLFHDGEAFLLRDVISAPDE